jgi:hypothetical protein
MIIPPQDAVTKVVATLKNVTSRQLKGEIPHFLGKVDWDGNLGTWIFVSTVGSNEAIIRRRYVRYEGEQDPGQAQLEFCECHAWKGVGTLRASKLATFFDYPRN